MLMLSGCANYPAQAQLPLRAGAAAPDGVENEVDQLVGRDTAVLVDRVRQQHRVAPGDEGLVDATRREIDVLLRELAGSDALGDERGVPAGAVLLGACGAADTRTDVPVTTESTVATDVPVGGNDGGG